MNVDFLHNQIIRDTISPKFIESFNENLLPSLCLKYGAALEYVQFYEDHLADGFRISGIFYYPLTVVVSGVAKTEWISWQVSNYRHYDNLNPFTYKGQDFLTFNILENAPEKLSEKLVGRPIFSSGNTLPVIMSAASDEKTFLAGKYSQGFIDLFSAEITDAIEKELLIGGLAGSGVVIEMRFAPGTFMEHISENVTYRRVLIKARACSARDLWVKWTRLDGNGTYTISDNVDRSMISFELAENVPGKIKEKEYRYLTTESIEKYQSAMSRKNITEWREMMRRVIKRGEVEKYERIKISKPAPELVEEAEEETVIPEQVAAPAPMPEVSAVKISAGAAPQERDDITERLNALLGKSDAEFAREPEILAENINSDLSELLRGALGVSAPVAEESEEVPEEAENELEATDAEEEEIEKAIEALEAIEAKAENESVDESDTAEDTLNYEENAENTAKSAPVSEISEEKAQIPQVDESEIEARIRRELEEKMRAEMDELRKKNEEAMALREKLEAQKRSEARERELLAEAARQAVLDKEKREADLRAEAEHDRIEAERKAEAARQAEEERRKAEEAKAEAERIEAEIKAATEREAAPVAESPKYVSKTVSLIFRRGGVDKNMTKRVHEIILATIKYLGKEDVYMRIKATVPDPTTLTLVFSEIPEKEQQLIVDIIQVLGKSNIGITKAILE